MNSEELLTLANHLADAAEAVIRPHFRTKLDITAKADDSPVTIADRGAEKAMRDILEANVPDHGILGEEYGSVRLDAETVWVLDPIDGTKAFITGVTQFGTLIAAARGGVPFLGVINQPILKERWIGCLGPDGTPTGPATFNGAPVETRDCGALDNAVLMITHPSMLKSDEDKARFDRLEAAVSFTRFGGDCYAYAMLAMGFCDIVIEASLEPYDFAALIPVVEAAGGVMTDWDGNRLSLDSDGHVIAAATPALHAAALEILSR